MQKFTDEDIIRGCQQGLVQFQELLYRTYYSDLMKVTLRYLSNDDDASIVLNDSFMKIFSNIANFELKGSFEGWLKRIVVNTCLDYLKSKAYRKQKETKEIVDFELSTKHDLESEFIQKMNFKELLALVQDLDETERTVFNLYVFENMNHKEIAQIMGFTENTSSWYLYKARKNLKSKIVNSKIFVHLN